MTATSLELGVPVPVEDIHWEMWKKGALSIVYIVRFLLTHTYSTLCLEWNTVFSSFLISPILVFGELDLDLPIEAHRGFIRGTIDSSSDT